MLVYTFSENIISSLFFWVLNEEVPHFQQKIFCRFVITAFFCVQRNISDEIFVFKIYKTILLIGLWGKNFRRLSKNFSAGSKNCILQVWGIFEEQKFFESRVQNQFRSFLENFWSFVRYSKQCCHVCTLRVKMIV